MLSIDILQNKQEKVINGQSVLDLVSPSMNNTIVPNYTKAVITTEEMVMRPDLAAQMYCGSHNKVGILLKVNSISNPFSVDANELLLIPDRQTMDDLAKPRDKPINTEARNSFRKQLQDRISQVSNSRKEYLNAVNISTEAQLPPNVTQEGQEQFKVVDGKLIFGSDIGVCRTKIQQNKSVATIKSRFAQRQIFES
jgi:hypothetical protein